MQSKHKLLIDTFTAIKLWRVWVFLGAQDIKARFRRSFLGPLWIVLNIALFVGGAGVVYGLLFGQPMGEFLPFLAAGSVIWGFLVSSLTDSGLAFINAEGYIKQFSYPKQIYLLRTWICSSTILLIGLSALIPVQLIYQRFDLWGWILALPGAMLLALAALGHITICAYLGTRFRDLPHAFGGILQIVFFVTPILFPVKVLKERHLDFVYQYNPLYYLIDVVRHPILQGEFALMENYVFAGVYVVVVWSLAAMMACRFDKRVVFML